MPLRNFLSKNKKKHVIFDMDETLTTLHIDWSGFRSAFYNTMREIDSTLVDSFEKKAGRTIDLHNKFVTDHGNRGKRAADEFCENWETTRFSGHTVNDDLIKFIKSKPNDYVYHVWTSNSRKTALPVLGEMGIKSLFKSVVTKDDVHRSKPAPDGFYVIFDGDNFHRDDYLMVGNSDHDRDAAQAAGIDFVRIQNVIV